MSTLKLIEGGIKSKERAEKIFVKASVSNTRLMGVIGLFVHWKIQNCDEAEDLLQWFYFEIEAPELNSYQCMWQYEENNAKLITENVFGCLGGELHEVSEKEAIYLVQKGYEERVKFMKKEQDFDKETRFILDKEIELSEVEKKELFEKTCADIKSEYGVINYFLMRLVGRDFDGALALTREGLTKEKVDILPWKKAGTFHKNDILKFENEYTCKSIISIKHQHYIAQFRMRVKNLQVQAVELISSWPITTIEAAMNLNKSEYISVYEENFRKIDMEENVVVRVFDVPWSYTVTEHENGVLAMLFKPDNSHVEKQHFRLNDDVIGVVYNPLDKQVVVAAYTREDIESIEKGVFEQYNGMYDAVARYFINNGIMLNYVDSGYTDFISFMKAKEKQGEIE